MRPLLSLLLHLLSLAPPSLATAFCQAQASALLPILTSLLSAGLHQHHGGCPCVPGSRELHAHCAVLFSHSSAAALSPNCSPPPSLLSLPLYHIPVHLLFIPRTHQSMAAVCPRAMHAQWAVLFPHSSSAAPRSSSASLLAPLLADPSPKVRVAAAQALASLLDSPLTLTFLHRTAASAPTPAAASAAAGGPRTPGKRAPARGSGGVESGAGGTACGGDGAAGPAGDDDGPWQQCHSRSTIRGLGPVASLAMLTVTRVLLSVHQSTPIPICPAPRAAVAAVLQQEQDPWTLSLARHRYTIHMCSLMCVCVQPPSLPPLRAAVAAVLQQEQDPWTLSLACKLASLLAQCTPYHRLRSAPRLSHILPSALVTRISTLLSPGPLSSSSWSTSMSYSEDGISTASAATAAAATAFLGHVLLRSTLPPPQPATTATSTTPSTITFTCLLSWVQPCIPTAVRVEALQALAAWVSTFPASAAESLWPDLLALITATLNPPAKPDTASSATHTAVPDQPASAHPDSSCSLQAESALTDRLLTAALKPELALVSPPACANTVRAAATAATAATSATAATVCAPDLAGSATACLPATDAPTAYNPATSPCATACASAALLAVPTASAAISSGLSSSSQLLPRVPPPGASQWAEVLRLGLLPPLLRHPSPATRMAALTCFLHMPAPTLQYLSHMHDVIFQPMFALAAGESVPAVQAALMKVFGIIVPHLMPAQSALLQCGLLPTSQSVYRPCTVAARTVAARTVAARTAAVCSVAACTVALITVAGNVLAAWWAPWRTLVGNQVPPAEAEAGGGQVRRLQSNCRCCGESQLAVGGEAAEACKVDGRCGGSRSKSSDCNEGDEQEQTQHWPVDSCGSSTADAGLTQIVRLASEEAAAGAAPAEGDAEAGGVDMHRRRREADKQEAIAGKELQEERGSGGGVAGVWQERVVEAILSCALQTNPKASVQWSVCAALSLLLQNPSVHLPSSPWTSPALATLQALLQRSSNFKIRIHAAAALSALLQRSSNFKIRIHAAAALLQPCARAGDIWGSPTVPIHSSPSISTFFLHPLPSFTSPSHSLQRQTMFRKMELVCCLIAPILPTPSLFPLPLVFPHPALLSLPRTSDYGAEFGAILRALVSSLASLDAADQQQSAVEQRYKPVLTDQISATLLHMTSLSSLEDLRAARPFLQQV
ncbi:unnamed protein product [Closterium sp. Naga37s-1]|nr:unnamed protein product [Closterium sp. Naga37s-1]